MRRELYPDAHAPGVISFSTYGWGGVLNGTLPVRGDWTEREQRQHITLKELRAVRLTMEHFAEHLVGKRVRLHEDNQAVVAVLTTYTSRSPEMMREVRRIWQLQGQLSVALRVEYIRSEANVWADHLSRVLDPADYSVSRDVFEWLEQRWGPHTVDRFAAPHNTQLPRFNSLYSAPGSEAVDAFTQDWSTDNNYCHPPVRELGMVAALLEDTGAAATVLAPDWPEAPWYGWLRELAAEVVPLPWPRRLVAQPGPNPGAVPPYAPRFVVFRVSGSRQDSCASS